MSPWRRRTSTPRAQPRSFTLRERSAVDSLARHDNRQAQVVPVQPVKGSTRRTLRPKASPGGRDPYSVSASVRFAPAERGELVGTGAEASGPDSLSGMTGAFPSVVFLPERAGGRVTEGPPVEQEAVGAARRVGMGIGRATAVMMGGTLLSRVTGLLRLVVAAYALGIGKLSDAFNLANNTPNIVHDLVLGGILSATFVPLFVDRLARRSEGEATDSISAVVSLSAVVLVVATVLFVLFAPFIIDLYSLGTNSPHIGIERSLATELLRMFALQLLAYGAISLMTAVLNAVRRFSLPAYVPVINNVIAIAVLLEFAVVARHPSLVSVAHDSGLVLLLGLGTTAGVVAQAIALVPSTLRSGLRIRFRWDPHDDAVHEIARLSGWTLGFVVANQIALFVSLALAVHIDPKGGAVTAYTYAFTFFQLPFGMIAVSVMSAVTPELAHRWTTRDLPGMARQFGLGLRRMMAGIWPATAGYLVLAGPVMKLLLQHREANAAGVHLTGSMLALLAVGLPGYCTYLLAITALQAMRDTRSAFFLYLLENGLNIVLLFVLTHAIGPQGLALSLSIAYSAAALAALVVVRHKVGGLGGAITRRYVARSFALALVMAVCVAVVSTAVGSSSGVGLLERVVVGVAVGVAVYGGGAALAGVSRGWQTADGRQRAAGKRA